VSRPDEVTGASLTIRSFRNLYSVSGDPVLTGARVAWTIDGGSTAPIPGLVPHGTSSDVMRFTSIDDRIEGFPGGIAATAAKRHSLTSSLVSNNDVELHLIGLQLTTEFVSSFQPADFIFAGARADGDFVTGNDNRLRVLMTGVTGSGPRANSYDDEVGSPQHVGTGNELEFISSLQAFLQRNARIEPAPDLVFFRDGSNR